MGEGPTIIYVPTRKETEAVAKFLCGHGVVAAAYHAKVTYEYNYPVLANAAEWDLCFHHKFEAH